MHSIALENTAVNLIIFAKITANPMGTLVENANSWIELSDAAAPSP